MHGEQNGDPPLYKRAAQTALFFSTHCGPLARFRKGWLFPFRYLRCAFLFWCDFIRYSRMEGAESLKLIDLQPSFFQRGAAVKVDPHYFHAHIWALKHLAKTRPALHVDVASSYAFIGVLSALMKVQYVELNPPLVKTENVEIMRGDLLNLPFPDNSVRSLSCLHAAEHVGLGRYGDQLDPAGTRKATAELARILASDGELLFAVPIGRERVMFNGQRIHSSQQIVEYFRSLELVEYDGVDDRGTFRAGISLAELDESFCALGCFRFRKPANGLHAR